MKPLVYILLLLTVSDLSAQNMYLSGEIAELIAVVDAIPSPGEALPEEALNISYMRSLQRAREGFAAMIFGLYYNYIPGDRRRGIADSFIFTPVVDERFLAGELQVYAQKTVESTLYTRFHYYMTEDEWKRRDMWVDTVLPTAQGLADAPHMEEALSQAFRQAVREHLQKLTANKPAESTGVIVPLDLPRFFFRSGSVYSVVEIAIQVETLHPYNYF